MYEGESLLNWPAAALALSLYGFDPATINPTGVSLPIRVGNLSSLAEVDVNARKCP